MLKIDILRYYNNDILNYYYKKEGKMALKKWKITAELNHNASNFATCIVEAHTEKKAAIMADKYFRKKLKAFFVIIHNIDEIND